MAIPKRHNIKPKVFTHTGEIVRRETGERIEVKLRETAKLWVTPASRYGKSDGKRPGTVWQPWTLDLSTIKPIEGGV